MKSSLPAEITSLARHSLARHHAPRIERCLRLLTAKQIWWRPNARSNSVGNLALHLAGNVRQWIIAGLGGKPFERDRNREFAERGPVPRQRLITQLRSTVRDACRVIARLSERDLRRLHPIQGFEVSGLRALLHVTEHFAFHTGQVIAITKQLTGKDLGFTRLPGERRRKIKRLNLPTL
jgi:uncharacterized damage-inducible protein DinB